MLHQASASALPLKLKPSQLSPLLSMAFSPFSSTQLHPEDEAEVRALSDELRVLKIATRNKCEKLARALWDVGVSSLNSLVASKLTINKIEDLLGKLNNPQLPELTILQMEIISKWIEDRRQETELAAAPNAGEKRPNPSASPPPRAARHALPAAPEPAVHVAVPPQAAGFPHFTDPEATLQFFIEMT